MAAAAKKQERGRQPVGPNPQEEIALNDATNALVAWQRSLPAGTTPHSRTLAAVVISAWIISRSRQAAGIRLAENVVFDFENAQLKGLIEAALPQIGAALSDLPDDVPFFALPKEDVVRVFTAGVLGAREAAIARGEGEAFPFDDPIPFGD